MSDEKVRGKCEGCGNAPRVLTQIESGQLVCVTCLREIRGPKRPEYLATIETIKQLRAKGYDVSEELTKVEGQRLEAVDTLRAAGMTVPLNATFPELQRLGKIQALRSRGVHVCDSVSATELAVLHDSVYRVHHFFSKVVGVTHKNPDGSYRQRIIRKLRPLDLLELNREPNNRYDPYAVAVHCLNGPQIGHLTEELAARVGPEIDKGYRYGAYVASVTGGEIERPTLGVNLLILVGDPGVMDESFVAYFNRQLATDKDFLADTGATSARMEGP